jgi:hypothetical protein
LLKAAVRNLSIKGSWTSASGHKRSIACHDGGGRQVTQSGHSTAILKIAKNVQRNNK